MREMKDSGIEWIGQIPKDWVTIRIGNVFSLRNERNYLLMEQVQLLSLYSGKGVFPTGEEGTTNSGNHAQTVAGYKIVKRNDIVVNIILAWMGSLGISNYDGVVSPAYDVYIPDEEKVVPHYYHYVFRTSGIANECYRYGRGIMMMRWRTYSSEFKRIHVPFPPLEEQQQIADYLDTQCSEIDATAEDIQKEISLLEDYKKSVITEAVTKGLNPDAEMKDSGIEWIGQIPKDWEFPKITHILDYTHPYPIGDGDHGTIKAENYSEEGIPFIRVQNLGFATELIMNNVVYITEKQNNGIINSTLYPNDILFAKTGATIGKVGIMPENIKKANTTSHVGKITVSEEVVPKYIFYVLSSFIGYKQFWDIALMKSTRPELSIDEIKTLHVLLPKTKEEQQQIADFLDTKCSEIDSLIADKKRQLDILADYKKSLIYEYVTGKKEVPVNE